MQNTQFTDDDLSLLRHAAVLAGAMIAITKYSGSGGTRDEFSAIFDGLREAASRYPDNPLLTSLTTDATRIEAEGFYPQFQRDPTQKTYDDFKMAALNRCGQAAELLKQKASPEQAAEVKAVIVSMCEHVAERSKEGKALGFGGIRVDPLETAAIEQVKRALEA